MIVIYGIRNCDTVKKALKWFEDNELEYEFYDYKKSGVDANKLQEFIKKFGWEKVINSKSRVLRALDEEKKPTNAIEAIALMKENSSIIKRPIIDSGEIKLLGFDAKEYREAFLLGDS